MNRPSVTPLTVLLGLALAAGAGAVETQTIPLRPYAAGWYVVDVSLAGATYPFLFDTGGGFTVITPRVARAIDCDPIGRSTGYRPSGERVDTPLCPSVELTIQDRGFPQARVGVYDIMALLPDGLPELGGLLSLKSFQDQVVTLDLARRELIVETEASLAHRIEGMTPTRVRWATGPSGDEIVSYVPVASETGRVWFMLDNGNTGPVLVAPHAARALGYVDDTGDSSSGGMRVTIEGIGRVELRPTLSEMIHDGILSAAWMHGWVFTMDLRNRRLWTSPVE